jgi:hypothetical protein
MGTAPNRRPRVGLPIAVGGAGGVFRTRGAGQVATVGVATMYLCVCTGVTDARGADPRPGAGWGRLLRPLRARDRSLPRGGAGGARSRDVGQHGCRRESVPRRGRPRRPHRRLVARTLEEQWVGRTRSHLPSLPPPRAATRRGSAGRGSSPARPGRSSAAASPASQAAVPHRRSSLRACPAWCSRRLPHSA